jgi:hypothetical protein
MTMKPPDVEELPGYEERFQKLVEGFVSRIRNRQGGSAPA